MYMYMHMYMYMYLYMCTYMYMYIYIYVYVYMIYSLNRNRLAVSISGCPSNRSVKEGGSTRSSHCLFLRLPCAGLEFPAEKQQHMKIHIKAAHNIWAGYD